nr:NAD(P)H-dependent oxidoreductase [Shewanella sp. NIFS-20-20]
MLSGHPDLKQSVANAEIIRLLQAEPTLTCRCLDELYPSYGIDVDAEQQALMSAELVVLQFPLYWSTYPALMKLWFDQVFSYGFAFGPAGSKLKDKPLILSITCGATAASYGPDGFNFFELDKYLAAAMHPVHAAQMAIVDTVVTFEMNSTPAEGGDVERVMQLSQQHAQQLLQTIRQYKNKI